MFSRNRREQLDMKEAQKHGNELRIHEGHNLFIMIIVLLMCSMFKGGF